MTADSAFIHRVPRRPKRYRIFEMPTHTGFVHQVDVRPGRFLVGPDEDPDPPTERLTDAPVNAVLYLGRVDEVDPDVCTVTATVWEHPSGREGLLILPIDEDFEGPVPAAGDLLRIWTWVELPGGGREVPRKLVRVERRELSVVEKEDLRRFLKEWQAERGAEE